MVMIRSISQTVKVGLAFILIFDDSFDQKSHVCILMLSFHHEAFCWGRFCRRRCWIYVGPHGVIFLAMVGDNRRQRHQWMNWEEDVRQEDEHKLLWGRLARCLNSNSIKNLHLNDSPCTTAHADAWVHSALKISILQIDKTSILSLSLSRVGAKTFHAACLS